MTKLDDKVTDLESENEVLKEEKDKLETERVSLLEQVQVRFFKECHQKHI